MVLISFFIRLYNIHLYILQFGPYTKENSTRLIFCSPDLENCITLSVKSWPRGPPYLNELFAQRSWSKFMLNGST